MLNKGEKGEIAIIKKLFLHRNDRSFVHKHFGYNSCIELMHPWQYDKWITHGFSCITRMDDIQKAGGLFKADIVVIFHNTGIIESIKRISIKCFDGGAPTILNHTPRISKCWRRLAPPDAIVAKMNRMRSSGEAGEDIPLARLNLDVLELENLKKIITYFVSRGTGARFSKVPCDSILYSKNNEITHFYPSVSEYVEDLIVSQKLILSIRSKKGLEKAILKDEKWLFREPGGGKPKGLLNIRLTTSIL